MDKHWIPLFLWTLYNDFYFLEKPVSSIVNVHFFRGIQKSFPRTRTTITTNKPFLRPRPKSHTTLKQDWRKSRRNILSVPREPDRVYEALETV